MIIMKDVLIGALLLTVCCIEHSAAWTTGLPSVHQGSRSSTSSALQSLLKDDRGDHVVPTQTPASSSSSRRDWLRHIGQSTAASISVYSAVSSWSAAPAFAAARPSVLSSASTCDATVTVWQRGDRVVYLLGTAHISELSAQLAGNLVREIRPNAVFVELDLKRIGGGAVAKNVNDASKNNANQVVLTMEAPSGSADGPTVPTRIIIPNVTERQRELLSQQQQELSSSTIAATATNMEAVVAAATPTKQRIKNEAKSALVEQAAPRRRRGFGSMVMNASSNAVGGAIRGMYQNLDKAGFKPGDEFAVAIRQGQAIGADIVLGDQDVELTLSRLTQALASTDLKKLLSADSEIEASMKELIGGPAMVDANSSDAMKQDLTTFVESIKTRESVRTLLGSMRRIAPALVQVMLTERDAYMAAGIDSLTQETVMVAVMGIAHVDGVEDNLKRQGWSQARLNCAKYK